MSIKLYRRKISTTVAVLVHKQRGIGNLLKILHMSADCTTLTKQV